MSRARIASEVILTPIAPNFPSPTITSILPFSKDCFTTTTFGNLQWYDWWLYQQVHAQPKELFSSILGISDSRWTEAFGNVWQEIARYLTTHKSGTIDDVVAFLLDSGDLHRTSDVNANSRAQSLVFAIIGWQTMLYQPDIGSCSFSQLAIGCQMGLHQGQCHMLLKQGQSRCKKPMHDFLLNFGVLLPPGQFSVAETSQEKEAFNRWQTISPQSFNAHFLTVFGKINIKWVDSLPCHMEFDSDTNTLFLFRYPSFCLLNTETIEGSTQSHKSVLHSCAVSCPSKQWATQEEITQMLQETILSFRLLFGQDRASQRLYKTLEPFRDIPDEGIDPFCRPFVLHKSPERPSNFPKEIHMK